MRGHCAEEGVVEGHCALYYTLDRREGAQGFGKKVGKLEHVGYITLQNGSADARGVEGFEECLRFF